MCEEFGDTLWMEVRSSVPTVSIFTHFVILQSRVRSLDGANYNSYNDRKDIMLVICNHDVFDNQCYRVYMN